MTRIMPQQSFLSEVNEDLGFKDVPQEKKKSWLGKFKHEYKKALQHS